MADDSIDERERARARLESHEDPLSRRSLRVASPLSPEEDRIIYEVIGSAIAVHRALGPGFLESIYRKAMCIELTKRNLTYDCERPIHVAYEGVSLRGQRVDLIVGGLIVVELKAVARFEEIHRSQVISYLRTLGLRGGLLINFRVRVLKHGVCRIVLT
jgi:GxxExxY protein